MPCAALIAWFAGPLPALAQDNVVATATLPRDLSPWRMYLNADPVVKAVLIGLVFASMGAARDRARTRGRHSAVVIYNVFARSIAGYRAELDDAAAEVLRLVRAV